MRRSILGKERTGWLFHATAYSFRAVFDNWWLKQRTRLRQPRNRSVFLYGAAISPPAVSAPRLARFSLLWRWTLSKICSSVKVPGLSYPLGSQTANIEASTWRGSGPHWSKHDAK